MPAKGSTTTRSTTTRSAPTRSVPTRSPNPGRASREEAAPEPLPQCWQDVTDALAAGIDLARGEFVVLMDADLQNDPADIPRLLATVRQGFDLVSGWRKDRHDAYLSRRLPSEIANRIIAHVTGVPLHDVGCTLKIYRSEYIKDVQIYGEMHRFLPALVKQAGGTITEVVVNHHPRKYGTSKIGRAHV